MKRQHREKSNHPKSKLLQWFFTLLIVGAILGSGYFLFNYVPFFSRLTHYVILTESMEPIINADDLVIVDQHIPPTDLSEGDIIAFKVTVRSREVVVVHYLAQVIEDPDSGITTYRTKPEVSSQLDNWVLEESDIVGRHLLTIPKVGGFLQFVQAPIGKLIFVVDVLALYWLFKFIFKKEDKVQQAT
ncbi:MAG: S24/S26 family peptidase [Candidatus Izemoplasmatales bacterium]|nr:S24/S26 family peptidase [Candidatus Izemoplasmatales bacterium]MDY0374029.1 S24/S26 family peptidase [Candidatus Izemoplasmatales bacterium]